MRIGKKYDNQYVIITFYKNKDTINEIIEKVKEEKFAPITEINSEIFSYEYTYHNDFYRHLILSEDVGLNYKYNYNRKRKIIRIYYEEGVDETMLKKWSKDNPYLVKMPLKQKEKRK